MITIKGESNNKRKKELKLKVTELEGKLSDANDQIAKMKLGEDDTQLMRDRSAITVRLASARQKIHNLENHLSENGTAVETVTVPTSTAQFK